MGGGGHAACVERRASCPVDLEIPLLASFPYLLGGAERVPRGQWSRGVGYVRGARSRSPRRRDRKRARASLVGTRFGACRRCGVRRAAGRLVGVRSDARRVVASSFVFPRPVATCGHDRFPVDLSAIIAAGSATGSTRSSVRAFGRPFAGAGLTRRAAAAPSSAWRRRVIRSEDTARWGV